MCGGQPRSSRCGSQRGAKLCRGVQPRSSRCGSQRGAKLTKKRTIIAQRVAKTKDPLSKAEKWEKDKDGKLHYLLKDKVGELHYLLRMPILHTSGKPAPLCLFLHGSGERGKEDGSELSKVRMHGPWHQIGSAPFFCSGTTVSEGTRVARTRRGRPARG